jgi:hypothetical protein
LDSIAMRLRRYQRCGKIETYYTAACGVGWLQLDNLDPF